jgi:hypothetical protein
MHFGPAIRLIPCLLIAGICFYSKLLISPFLFAADVRLTVSDLLADAIMPVVREAAQSQGITLDIRSLGSLPAITEMRNDAIDLAVLAQPIGADPLDQNWSVIPLAFELVFVLTHRSNPINDISLTQLGGIFGSNETLNLTQWRELGVSDLAGRAISPVVLSDQNTMVMEIFRNGVLDKRRFRPSVNMLNLQALKALLRTESSAIALSSAPQADSQLKIISVSQHQGAPAFRPNSENAYFGDYPMRLPFVVVFPAEIKERLLPMLAVLLGDDVAAALASINKTPLPQAVRQGMLSDLRR